MSHEKITRRDFLQKAGAVAVAAGAGIPVFAGQNVQKRAKVVLVRDHGVMDAAGRIDQKVIDRMLDEAMAALFDVRSSDEAWKRIMKRDDIVGIKSNVWGPLRTPHEVENTIRNRLITAGVDAGNIGIDDRGVLSNPIFRRATALINTRPMRAHHWSGVGGCLKNYIMFSPNPPDYHPDSCVDLGALWKLPIVRGKTRLNVLVMLSPQFHCRGPHHFDREYTWQYKGVLVGTDPVALDAVGLRILEARRRAHFGGDSPMRPPVKHIVAAEERHGIGVADRERIDVMKLGWKEGVLI